MIKTEHGEVKISGSIIEISADVSVILKAYREMLHEELGDKADVMFAEIGRTACMETDELLSEGNMAETKRRTLEALKED